MSDISSYLATAIKAAALAKKGRSRFEIRDDLAFRYVGEADTAIRTGKRFERISGYTLTPDEIRLLHALARAEREKLQVGDLSSCKLKHITPWPWTRAKCERIARKRLDVAVKGEEELPPALRRTGLGLVEVYHGGYIRMRPAGWVVVHALEAMGGAA